MLLGSPSTLMWSPVWLRMPSMWLDPDPFWILYSLELTYDEDEDQTLLVYILVKDLISIFLLEVNHLIF